MRMLLVCLALIACEPAADEIVTPQAVTPATASASTAQTRPGATGVAAAKQALQDADVAMNAFDGPGVRAAVERARAAMPDDPGLERRLAVYEALGARLDLQEVEWLQGEAAAGGAQLVVFFEPWCPHCRNEMPELESVRQRWQDKGLDVVALTRLSRDSTREQVMELVSGAGARFPVGHEDGRVAKAAQVSGIPAAALVQEGRVVWRGHPGALDDATLQRLVSATAATP